MYNDATLFTLSGYFAYPGKTWQSGLAAKPGLWGLDFSLGAFAIVGNGLVLRTILVTDPVILPCSLFV